MRHEVIFSEADFLGVLPEIERLMHHHWAEITTDVNRPLSLAMPEYAALNSAGMVAAVEARCLGVLVGYVVLLLLKPLHYSYLKIASDDAHYIAPKHRSFKVARGLFDMAELVAKAHGADLIRFHTKATEGVNRDRLFEHLGYTPEDHTFMKRLGG